MSKNKKHKCPLDRILGKLNHICDIAEEMTTQVKNRQEPNLSILANELESIRCIREVWIGNTYHYTDELESAIVSAMTGKQREAA